MALTKKQKDAFKAFMHKFNYVTGGLSPYTEQDIFPFLTKALFSSRTPELIVARTGIKYKEVLNIMDATIFLQDGGTCADVTPSGSTTFTQREIEVNEIVSRQDFCLDDLNEFITQKLLPAGSYAEDLVPSELSDFMAGLLSQILEVAYWQGNTASGNPNLSKFDGLIKIIGDAGTAIAGNTSSETSITTANVVSIHDNMILALPAALLDKDDVVIFEGWDTYRKLIIGLKNQNNSAGFHYDSTSDAAYNSGEMRVLGTNIRVIAVHGLDATNRLFASRTNNLFIGSDLENDPMNWQLWYDINTDKVKWRSKFKLGTQIAFPNEIVQYTNA